MDAGRDRNRQRKDRVTGDPPLVQVWCWHYFQPVTFDHKAPPISWAMVFLLGLISPWAQGAPFKAKVIHLRNETIQTGAGSKANAHGQGRGGGGEATKPVSGLYLIQFTAPVQEAWSQTLSQRGVKLLRYVPEDSFIVRLNHVSIAALEELDFVHWVGPFRPDHKIQQAVRARRANAGVQDDDVAVSVLLTPDAAPAELERVRRAFQRLNQESHGRMGSIVRGTLGRGQLETLAESPSVLWIEPYRGMKLFDEVASKIVAGDGGPNVTQMQTLGWDGSGVTVAVADSGLNNGDAETMHPDLDGRVDAFFFYGNLTDAADEHSHGTHVTGIIAGDATVGETDENGALFGLGVAPKAHIVAQRLFDGVGNFEAPPTFEILTRDAVQAGAEIGSNSWGDDTQGRYDTFAQEFDLLVRDADMTTPGDQPYILEFSAGNAGPGSQTVGTPAVAKNVIATGASQNDRLDLFIYGDGKEVMADFSSRGPAEDGRIKPDVTAPGTWIASLQSASATDENAWLPISDFYQYQGGTSQAGPHVSGAAAIFVQYYRTLAGGKNPSPALVKAALINSATDMDDSIETDPAPNNDEGWGRVDLTNLIGETRQHEFIDQTTNLITGQVYEHQVVVADAEQPLKLTLVYTDPAAFPGAIPALVNDLDLEVISPDGVAYHGNQFLNGESVRNPPSYDRINNVEAVHLAVPLPGIYTVRVRARSVVVDARRDTATRVDQDFALDMSGSLPLPGSSIVFFDRRAYRVPGQIKVTVLDLDMAGQLGLNVLLRSQTESPGETIRLLPTSTPGAFSATVQTALGTPVADGRLQIADGNLIEAFYQDGPAGPTRQARARADLQAPDISGLTSEDIFGRVVITWDTDELTDATVYYGTVAGQWTVAADTRLDSFHEVVLGRLAPDTTYYYFVTSVDEAGNLTTDDRNGMYYTFTPAAPPAVLLVDEYVDLLFSVPPLSGYTDALDAIGVSYVVWDATAGNVPTFEDLEPFRAVIWRVPEFFLETFSPTEQGDIVRYLDSGGSLLVSSMEVLSRLEEQSQSAFAHDVLKVSSFVPDNNLNGVPRIRGVASDPITAGMDILLDYSPYYDPFKEDLEIPEDISDVFTPVTEAVPILFDGVSGNAVGLRFPKPGVDSPGRLVFLSFPLDAVPLHSVAGNDRISLLGNILEFLAPAQSGAVVVLDKAEYSVPGQVVVEITDLGAIGRGTLVARAKSDSVPAGINLTLRESVRLGLFRGFLALTPGPSGVPGELWVQDGDLLEVQYSDVGSGVLVSAKALIETTPPDITGVDVEPSFVDAVVRWETSEPSDSLVQFGESTLLGRTAYQGALSTSHEVQLTLLQPNQTYYFQVVSQDLAGNQSLDNNGNGWYQFRTESPLVPDWEDLLEEGDADWFVVNEDFSETGWQLGVPQNDQGVSAYSPVNAWGSNLNGENIGGVETWLISPPIFLTGGTEATLTFKQNYGFPWEDFAIYDFGELLLITNVTVAPILLDEVTDFSGGWIDAEYNLTPHMGKLVYVVWHYAVFSFENLPRLGWLIDDVAITVSGTAYGTIVITNNLAQAQWHLDGPLTRNGSGITTTIPNAPEGEYTLFYGDVPYYQTPPSNTRYLNVPGQVTFQGQYTFADANHNRMSDAWEQAQFGEVSPARTPNTDTDGDSFTDEAEFVAGTNPKLAGSNLEVSVSTLLVDGSFEVAWTSVPGRMYRIVGSTDARHWSPVTDWVRAPSTQLGQMLPPAAPGAPFLFRVEVRP